MHRWEQVFKESVCKGARSPFLMKSVVRYPLSLKIDLECVTKMTSKKREGGYTPTFGAGSLMIKVGLESIFEPPSPPLRDGI